MPEAMDLEIQGKMIQLDSTLYRCLESEYKTLWDEFEPTGPIAIHWKMLKKGTQSKTRLHILPQGCSLKYQKFPYRIPHLTVVADKPRVGVYVADGQVAFHHILGVWDQSSVEFNGNFYAIQETKSKAKNCLKLSIVGYNLKIDSELRQAIAKYFPDLMKSLEPQGILQQFRLNLSQYIGGDDYLEYQMQLQNLDAPMKPDGFLQHVQGNVELQGYAYQGKHHIQGSISNGMVKAKRMVLRNWKSTIQFFQNYLFLHNMTGTFYDGDFQGSLVFDVSPYGAYKGFISTQNAHLNGIEMALADGPNAKATMSGLLNGELFFQGNLHSSKTLTGKGHLLLKDGAIWQFPIFLALLDIFSLPSRPAFREGEINLGLFENQATITSLRFDSSVISISGSGTVDFDGNLELTLLTHFTSDLLPRIPLIDKVWNGLTQDLFSLSVRGTLAQPSVSLKQWGNVKDFLEKK